MLPTVTIDNISAASGELPAPVDPQGDIARFVYLTDEGGDSEGTAGIRKKENFIE